MMLRRTMITVLVVALLAIAVGNMPSQAQDDDMMVIASGLTNPRGLYYAEDGTLYIAEAGNGGDIETEFVSPTGMPTVSGASARISMVSPDGEQSVAVYGLFSTNAGGVEVVGAHDVYVSGDSMWVLNGQGPLSVPDTYTLMELDPETTRIKTVLDLLTFEIEQNPDGAAIDSNPTDFVVDDDGTFWIVDAGCNCLLTWVPGGELELVKVWEENPVPTSVALGIDNDLYVSFLSAAPFIPGSARIERWSKAGELLDTFGGLTTVVDLLVEGDGTVYAVQFAMFDLEAEGNPWTPGSGSLVTVGADGTITPIYEGLTFPYGIAQAPDGTIVVADQAAFMPPGSGQVIIAVAG